MNANEINSAVEGQVIRDDVVRGLHVKVTKTQKAFYLYFRTKCGQERRPKIGTWPSVNISEARKVAKEILLSVALGNDPTKRAKSNAEPITCLAAWGRYELEILPRKKTAQEDIRVWSRYVLPFLEKKAITELDYDLVFKIHSGLSDTPYQANRVVSLLSSFLAQCERWGYRSAGSNPCILVKRFKEKPRTRYLTPQEAERISTILKREESRHPDSVAFIHVLMLTGARCGEIASATWEQVQGDKLVLAQHKTAGKGCDRVIHLPPVALELILRLMASKNWTPSTAPRDQRTIFNIQSPKKLWDKIRKEAGCPDLRLHDLRHSFASVALGLGYTLPQIGALLGHTSSQTTNRYAHLMDQTAKAVSQAVANKIADTILQ